MRFTTLCVLIIFSFSCLFGCQDFHSPAEQRRKKAAHASADDKIYIGAAAPWATLTHLGYYRQGLEMALEEINRQGVLGRQVELVMKDDRGSLKQGRIIAQEFVENPDISAVIGHYNSSVTKPVSLIYQHYGLLMITATSTDPAITDRDGFDLIFRNIPTDEEVARQLADFCLTRNYKRMVVYSVDTAYGNSLARAFENRATRIGINIVDRRSYDNETGDFQFQKIIQTWKEYYLFDAIFLAGIVPQAARFIVQCRQQGVHVPVIGGDGLDSPLLWEIGGNLVDGTIVGTFFHPDQDRPESQKFVKAFQARYGCKPDAWAAQAYDTLKILAHAMNLAQSTLPEKVARVFRTMDPVQGVTGEIRFNEKGDVVNKKITTKIVHDHKFEFLETGNAD